MQQWTTSIHTWGFCKSTFYHFRTLCYVAILWMGILALWIMFRISMENMNCVLLLLSSQWQNMSSNMTTGLEIMTQMNLPKWTKRVSYSVQESEKDVKTILFRVKCSWKFTKLFSWQKKKWQSYSFPNCFSHRKTVQHSWPGEEMK